MTIRELINQLKKFDPEKKVWVLYDDFDLYEASFGPTDPDYLREHTLMEHDDIQRVSFGDLLMEVG